MNKIIFILLMLFVSATAAQHSDNIPVNIQVIDEQGNPILSAEVWRVVNMRLRPTLFAYQKQTYITFDYLDRITSRFKDIPEFVGPWRPGFAQATSDTISNGFSFRRVGPSDPKGRIKDLLVFDVSRPEVVTIKYSALSYGYVPGQIQFNVNQGDVPTTQRIVLKRNPNINIPEAHYWKEFARIRYESDYHSPTFKNDAEPYRTELISVAQKAEAAGDHKTAARIYSWAPHIPTIIKSHSTSGSLVIEGYTRETETSARNIEVLEKAYSLDPNNQYVKMKKVLLHPPHSIESKIIALEDLLREGRDGLWPEIFVKLETAYYETGRRDEAFKLSLWFKEFEPEDWRNEPDQFKTRQARYISIEEFQQKYLVGGNPNQKDEFKNLPIYYAISAGRVDLYEWLLKNHVETPLPDRSLLQAIASGNPKMVKILLESDPRVTGITRNLTSELSQIKKRYDSPWANHKVLDEMKNLIDSYNLSIFENQLIKKAVLPQKIVNYREA